LWHLRHNTAQEAINVLNGTADLYVWGTIFYSDVFWVDRETNFRMKYYFGKNQEAGLFRAIIEGNEGQLYKPHHDLPPAPSCA
jgi:hypothetical protein